MSIVDTSFFCMQNQLVQSDYDVNQIEAVIFSAEIEIETLVGETLVGEIIALHDQDIDENAADLTTDEAKRLRQFRIAVAYFGMKNLIPTLNTRPSNHGIIMSNNNQKYGDGTFSVASPSQIRQMEQDLEGRGRAMIAAWIPVTGVYMRPVE